MGKYDVYKNPNDIGYLVILQHEALEGIATIIVAPLVLTEGFNSNFSVLNPKLEVNDQLCVLLPEFMHATQIKNLKNPITNLSAKSYEITRALDMLFNGI